MTSDPLTPIVIACPETESSIEGTSIYRIDPAPQGRISGYVAASITHYSWLHHGVTSDRLAVSIRLTNDAFPDQEKLTVTGRIVAGTVQMQFRPLNSSRQENPDKFTLLGEVGEFALDSTEIINRFQLDSKSRGLIRSAASLIARDYLTDARAAHYWAVESERRVEEIDQRLRALIREYDDAVAARTVAMHQWSKFSSGGEHT